MYEWSYIQFMLKRITNPGRPRSFDADEVLERLIPVFFENGFMNTSFPQLEEAANLHRQSLRYAFGDKRGIFLAAVRRYGESKTVEIKAILKTSVTAIDGIRGVFAMWRADILRSKCRGCFLVSSAADRSFALDTELLGAINVTNQAIIALLEATFGKARDEGDVESNQSDRQLAQHMLTTADGVMALCQLPTTRETSVTIFDGFCAQLKS